MTEVKAQGLGSKENWYNQLRLTKRLYLPKYQSPIITIDFLRHVKNGHIVLPTVDQLKPFVCVFPPSIKQLRETLVEVLSQPEFEQSRPGPLIECLEKRSADKEWLLSLLHFVDPEQCYFRKDYRPEGKKPEEKEMILCVNNDDGFFTEAGLPLKGKPRANLRLMFTQEERDEIKTQ